MEVFADLFPMGSVVFSLCSLHLGPGSGTISPRELCFLEVFVLSSVSWDFWRGCGDFKCVQGFSYFYLQFQVCPGLFILGVGLFYFCYGNFIDFCRVTGVFCKDDEAWAIYQYIGAVVSRSVGNKDYCVRADVQKYVVSVCYSVFVHGPTVQRGCVECIACSFFVCQDRRVSAQFNGYLYQVFRENRVRVRCVARSNDADPCAINRIWPSLKNFSEVESLSVLRLFCDIVIAIISSDFFFRFYVDRVVGRYPASASTISNVGGTVLQANMRDMLAIGGFQVWGSVALLTFKGRIKWTFPVLRVFNTSSAYFNGNKEWIAQYDIKIGTFTARSAVCPTIFVYYRTRIMSIYFYQVDVQWLCQMFPGAGIVCSI